MAFWKLAEKKQKKKTIRKRLAPIRLIGFIGYFISITCQFIGTKLSDAHTGSLVTSATPAFMVIFAALILKEKLTARRLLSTIIATIGVIIVIGWDIEIGSYFIGTIILVGAAITWVLLSIYVKIASIQFSSLVITTYAIFFFTLFYYTFYDMGATSGLYRNSKYVRNIRRIILRNRLNSRCLFLWNKGLELLDASIGSLFFFPTYRWIVTWLALIK